MSCLCDDAEPAAVYSERTVTAKKQHRCCECRGTIFQGERHEYHFGVWDGAALSYRICPRCIEARAYIQMHAPCFTCWSFGDMYLCAQELFYNESCRDDDEAAQFAEEIGVMKNRNREWKPENKA